MAVDTLVTGSKLTAIADAIRTVCDTDSTYTLDEMPNAILKGGGGGSSFDWSKVTSLQGMFQGAPNSLKSVDVSPLAGFNGFSISYMFANCEYMSTVTGLGVLNMKSILGYGIDASNVFAGNIYVTDIDFTGATWTSTHSVIDMSGFAYNAQHVQTIKLPNISNTNKQGLKLDEAFYGCSVLTSLDLSTVNLTNTSASLSMSSMCYDCRALTSVILPSADALKGWSRGNYAPFRGCTNLKELVVPAALASTPRPISLANGYLFDSTGAGANPNGTYIVVPDDLVAAYKAATNWSLFADHIVGKSEYFGG